MTNRDFELIARVLKEVREDVKRENSVSNIGIVDLTACRFATELCTTNERFDRERFLSTYGRVIS